MTTETARLRLPELAASQAQKHVTHNEALVFLDTLVQASVISKALTAPPGSPAEGDCYIVAGGGGTATGAWASWEKRIARFQDGQWTSFLPGAGSGIGWTCWVQDESTLYTFDGTTWMNALRGKTGGGISVQYVFSTTTTDSDPGNGTLRLNQATQNTATVIRADLLDVNGTDWTAALATLADSTSTVKGHIRLFSVSDPSHWLLFTVSAVASPTGYKNITVSNVASSSSSPFSNGDAVVLSFTRTGDQGSAGSNGTNGTNGSNGSNGTNGLDGVNPGTRWLFATSTSMADPSSGNLRFNNATLASATAIAVSANSGESGNPSVLAWLQAFDDSTNTLKGYILVKKVSAPQNFRIYSISALTDNTTWVQLTVAHVAGNGSFSASDVLSVEFTRAGDAGAGGGGGSNSIADGRLTLSTGTPIPSADQLAATTLYYTPHIGGKIALYNGASWDVISFSEVSISLSGKTADTNYDVFGYNNSGTLTLELLAWTNATTRATALVRQDGVLCKTGALTRRYLGTIRTTGTTGQCEDSAVKRFVWNAENRVPRGLYRAESADSWTHTPINTWMQANNSTANQLAVVRGLDIEPMACDAHSVFQSSNSTVQWGRVGIGLDSTSALVSGSLPQSVTADNVAYGNCVAYYNGYPGLGYHYLAWLEAAATTTQPWYGDAGVPTLLQQGIQGSCFA
jgi:hypothetical protein